MVAEGKSPDRIRWRLIFRARNRRQVARRLEVLGALSRHLGGLLAEPYGERPNCWDAAFVTPGTAREPPAVAFECLTAAGRLGTGWYIRGPLIQAGRLSLFSGVFALQQGAEAWADGLEWASFDLWPPSEALPGHGLEGPVES
jgi:hypothetical protein